MPKATLSFNLPEEASDYKLCNQAVSMACFIEDFGNELRSICKYHSDELKPCCYETYESIREKFWEMYREAGLSDG